MVSGETKGSQQSFFSDRYWIKNTGHSVELTDFAAEPTKYMRPGIAYSVLREGVSIKLGRAGLTDRQFKDLLSDNDIGTRRCEGSIVTTGIDPVTGDAFWFPRACYKNEIIVFINTDNGPIDLFSLGCGNLKDGPLFVPAPKPMVMNDDNFVPTPPACVGTDCTPPPVCEGDDCNPPPVCEENCTTPLRHAISFAMFTLADGTTVKIDGYGGEVKDPSDPEQYIAQIEAEYGQTVTSYTIKAGQGYYDETGTAVDPISHKADHEITVDQSEANTTTAKVTAGIKPTSQTKAKEKPVKAPTDRGRRKDVKEKRGKK